MKLFFSYWSCAALVAASLVAFAPTAATAQSAEYLADYVWVDGATGKFKCGNGRLSDLLCMSKMVHASPTKEHDDNDDFQGTTGRAA
jgi:hypothetical protein